MKSIFFCLSFAADALINDFLDGLPRQQIDICGHPAVGQAETAL